MGSLRDDAEVTGWQRIAIENYTLIPEEQARPIFQHRLVGMKTLCLTVRAGWG